MQAQTIQAIQDEARDLSSASKSDHYAPDDTTGCFATGEGTFTGKFRKHYSYDRFDEVYLENFENGCIVHKQGGPDMWFEANRRRIGFELAKMLGRRSKALNSLF